jgi:hypothetical protein
MQASAGDLPVEVDEAGDDALLSEAEVEAFEETAGGVLQAISLSGSQLFGTSIFQQLRKRNFFITSLTWRSRLHDVGNPVVEFNAEFENAENCQLFRYSANAWKVRRQTGEYQESFSPIPPAERSNFLSQLYAHAAACAATVVESSVSQATISSPQTGGN